MDFITTTSWTNSRIYFLGLATLTLLYYDFIMVSPYISPFFWSFIVCTFLRKPRDNCVAFLRFFVPNKYKQNTTWWNPFQTFLSYYTRIKNIATGFATLWQTYVITLDGVRQWIAFLVGIVLYVGLLLWSSTLDTVVLYIFLLIPLLMFLCFIFIMICLIFLEATTLASLGLLLVTVSTSVAVVLFVAIQCTREFTQGAGYAQESFLMNDQWKELLRLTPEITNVTEGLASGKNLLINRYAYILDYASEFFGGSFFVKEAAHLTSGWIERLKSNGKVMHQPLLNFDISESIYSMASSYGQSFAKLGFTTLFSTLSFVFTLIESSLTQLISIFTFLASSFYILQADNDVLDRLVVIIPDKQIQVDFSRKFRKYVNGIFLSTLLIGVLHAFITGFMCVVLEIRFVFTLSVLSAFLAIFPIVSFMWLFIALAFFSLWMGELFQALLITSVMCGMSAIDTAVYSEFFDKTTCEAENDMITHGPYVTGLAIALGVYAFSWNGLVIGPLLVFLTLIAYDIFSEKYSTPTVAKQSLRQKLTSSSK
eukprot:TRINITY_DN5405_c0_g1_i2.p1 TRINITY_DN5405_c0_g1~~TRINITY_DN5405_c0_g1_i2.p1  ORF type:complete len:538 (-),score=80.15 TRINITY_DN5405_c0_g1_i2:40-1653(-)